MADNNTTSLEGLKAELGSLRSQFEDLLKNANAKGQDAASDMASKIARELHSYGHKAAEGAGRIRDAGQAGLDEVGHHVKQNPLLSVLIAFFAGCLASCLFRNLR